MQDLNKINNNNEFEESASKTFFWKSTEKMKEWTHPIKRWMLFIITFLEVVWYL